MDALPFHIYALPGFLGLPHDWQAVFDSHPLQANLVALDLFEPGAILPFEDWAAATATKIEQARTGRPRVLIGYSLGGRLALQLALHRPQSWEAVVIVSAHLGLADEHARRLRMAQDEMWATRFETMPWNTLLDEWNGRGVFQNDTFAFARREQDYQRPVLAAALRGWSLGNQSDLSFQLPRLACPVLWMAGANDAVYAAQADRVLQEGLLQHPQSSVWLAAGCGHRVPWQQTPQFLSALMSFLEGIN